MIERFRYLPCALHPALSVPTWAKIKNGDLYDGSPYSLAGPRFFIDLAHPAGWDHAVRAYAAIKGVEVPESSSVAFAVDHEYARLFLLVNGEPADESAGRFLDCAKEAGIDCRLMDKSAGRREALCRAICAALNLDPNDVFPVSAS